MLFLYRLFRCSTKISPESERENQFQHRNQRKREQEAQQGWFESWFQRSPWLTTLISTLLGPLIILILLLTFGPFILHRLVSFIRERLNTIQIMVLRQQHQSISQGKEKDSSTKVQRQGGNVRLSQLTP